MKKLFLLAALLLSYGVTEAQEPLFNVREGLGLKGYDPVSYFTEAGAVKGNAAFRSTHEGVTYWFSGRKNKEAFDQSPEKYLPQYGGWCAYAMGEDGSLVEVDPETYKILDGKLFLFYNSLLNNTLKKWNRDEATLFPQAEKNWKKHLSTRSDD